MLEVLFEGEGSHISIKMSCSLIEIKSDTKISIFRSFYKNIRFLGVLFEDKPSFYEKLGLLHVKKFGLDRGHQDFGCLIFGKPKSLVLEKLLLELPGSIRNECSPGCLYINRKQLKAIINNLEENPASFLCDIAPLRAPSSQPIAFDKDLFRKSTVLGQFNKEFIIISCGEYVFAIDQHALHERILLEQLLSENPHCVYTASTSLENLKTFACKNAIKFGQDVPIQKLEKMVKTMSHIKFPSACAHGRISICMLLKRDS